MKNNREPESLRWLRHAEADLKYAQVLQREGGYYLVCYLSQQAAEKALKAFLYHSGVEKCSILDSYYIPTRYPNGLPDAIAPDVYDAATGHSALSMAKTTIDMAAAEIRGGRKG